MIILSQTWIDRGHVAKGAALTFSLGSCRLTMDEYAYDVSCVRLFIFCVLFAKNCLKSNGFMAWPLNFSDSDNSDRPRHNVKTAGFGALFVRRLMHVVRSIALCIACIGELNYQSYSMILKLVPFVRFDHLCCGCSLNIFAWSFPTFEAIPWMEPAVLLGSFEIKADLLGSSNRNLIAFSAGFSTSFTSSAINIYFEAPSTPGCRQGWQGQMCDQCVRISVVSKWVMSLSKRKNLCQS